MTELELLDGDYTWAWDAMLLENLNNQAKK